MSSFKIRFGPVLTAGCLTALMMSTVFFFGRGGAESTIPIADNPSNRLIEFPELTNENVDRGCLSSYTNPEKSSNLSGFIPPDVDLSHVNGQVVPDKFRHVQLPSRWDWREHGVSTVVQDQLWYEEGCGSCYAFASVAAVESRLQVKGAPAYDFSENNAKECNWYDFSCGGGNFWGLADLFAVKGLVLESCDPYEPDYVECNTSCPYIITLLELCNICGNEPSAPEVLKNYIYEYGPIYVGMSCGLAGTAWYDELEVYDGSYTLYYSGDPGGIGHAIVIIGWDDALPHAGGSGAWIVKNSFGTDWGAPWGYGTENGYFTIAYGSAGIGKWAAFMKDWQLYDENGGIMYYDEGGYTTAWGGYTDRMAWGMCRFDISSTTQITRVEFWTSDVTADIDVYLYDDFSGGTLSNLLTSSLDHSFDEVGYHSVVLPQPVEVTAGQDVYAAVKFQNTSNTYSVCSDVQGPIETGTTYVSHYGTSWLDAGTNWSIDVGIRIRYSTAPCIDSDADGYGDPDYAYNTCSPDNCRDIYNPEQTDSDDDGVGDLCDNCPDISNTDQSNSDGDTLGDLCDNCIDVTNPDQVNSDGDTLGDLCDNCVDVTNDDQTDTDEDGVGDACDVCPGYDDNIDTDGDGIPDDCDYVCGDANGDAAISVADAVFVISYIFKGGPAPDPLQAGDADCNGSIAIADPVYVINYIFKGGPEPCCP